MHPLPVWVHCRKIHQVGDLSQKICQTEGLPHIGGLNKNLRVFYCELRSSLCQSRLEKSVPGQLGLGEDNDKVKVTACVANLPCGVDPVLKC